MPEQAIELVVAGAGLAVLVQAEEWWVLRGVPDEDEILSAEEIVVLDAEIGAQGLIVQETSALRVSHITRSSVRRTGSEMTACRGIGILWTAMDLGPVEFWGRDLNLDPFLVGFVRKGTMSRYVDVNRPCVLLFVETVAK